MIDSKYIDQIFVHGESLQNYLITIIVPNKTKVVDFLLSKGINCDEKSCLNYFGNETLKNEIIKDMEIIGRKADLKGFELVRKIFLFSGAFTPENDLVTPTLKLKRHISKKYFANEIKKLYSK